MPPEGTYLPCQLPVSYNSRAFAEPAYAAHAVNQVREVALYLDAGRVGELVVLGTMSPNLSVAHLEMAARQMHRIIPDVVLGRCTANRTAQPAERMWKLAGSLFRLDASARVN